MRLETFRGKDLPSVFEQARLVLGEDAMVVRTTVERDGAHRSVEVVAASAQEIQQLRQKLAATKPLLPRSVGGRGASGPFILALVGPTGAGKTTTAAKLAVHPEAFGRQRVGVIALDTFRVGALEQLQTYAELAGLPLEIVYDLREVDGAVRRLFDCDVILVDTPGRGPKSAKQTDEWRELLQLIGPDEVHLVVPASIRVDVAVAARELFAPFGVTHMLLSKLDEVPGQSGLADLAFELDLPARWVTDGQDVPADLRPAASRILGSLGLRPETGSMMAVGAPAKSAMAVGA